MQRGIVKAVACASLLVLVGCGNGEDQGQAAEDRPPAGDRGSDDRGVEREEAPPAGGVLASADTMWGSTGGGPVRLDLLAVSRRGEDFIEVRFSLTATSDERVTPFSRLSQGSDYDTSGIIVEDVTAGERLLVLRDSADECVCSTNLGERIDGGTSREYFARLPAPVSDRVDVTIPTFPPLNDISVS